MLNTSGYLKKTAASMSFGAQGKNSSSIPINNNAYNISDIHSIEITTFDKVEDVRNNKKAIIKRKEMSIMYIG